MYPSDIFSITIILNIINLLDGIPNVKKELKMKYETGTDNLKIILANALDVEASELSSSENMM